MPKSPASLRLHGEKAASPIKQHNFFFAASFWGLLKNRKMHYYKMYKVVDSRTPVKAQELEPLRMGPTSTQFLKIRSTGDNKTTAHFNVVMPNTKTALSRYTRVCMRGRFRMHCVIANLDNTSTLLAFRALPLSALTESITVKFGNTVIARSNVFNTRLAAQYETSTAAHNKYLSTSQCRPDPVTRYETQTDLTGAIGNNPELDNSTSGMFNAQYLGPSGAGVDSLKSNITAKSVKLVKILDLNRVTIEYEYEINEVLPILPFSDSDPSDCGIIGVDRVEITLTMRPFTNALCSPSIINIISIFDNHEVTECLLLSSFIMPNAPSPLTNYRYFSPTEYVYTATGPFNNIALRIGKLPAIPSKIMLFAAPSDAWKYSITNYAADAPRPEYAYNPINKADILFPITSLSVDFCNSYGVLKECDPSQLYEISAMSGLQCSYDQFTGRASFANTYFNTNADMADPAPLIPMCFMNSAPVFIDVARFLNIPQNTVINAEYPADLNINVTVSNEALQACGVIKAADGDGFTFVNRYPAFNIPECKITAIVLFDGYLTTSGGQSSYSRVSVSQYEIEKAKTI
jgi:hypothetical protein